jgi:hypothetical protein
MNELEEEPSLSNALNNSSSYNNFISCVLCGANLTAK